MEDRPPLTLRNALLQRRLLVLAIVATFVLGAAILSLQTPVYAASAIIYLDVSRTAPGFDEGAAAGELLQHDFIVLSTSRAVLQSACAAPDVECTDAERASPETTLPGRITVSTDRGTSTLRVTARAPTATKQHNRDSARTFVLVAVPSPDTRPTAVLLRRTAKRAVLAATAGITRFQDARRTAELLRQSGVDVVAAILLPRGTATKSR